jgi:hypothetical protein
VGIHIASLGTGKVVLFSGDHEHIWKWNRGESSIWDPQDPIQSDNNPTLGRNLFCSGHCFLSDGRLFVAGGQSTNNHPEIGLTQTAQSFSGGAPVLPPGTSTRTISSSDAIAINTGTGETDEGSKIDRVSPYNNPIYAVRMIPSTSLDDPNTVTGWRQHGW